MCGVDESLWPDAADSTGFIVETEHSLFTKTYYGQILQIYVHFEVIMSRDVANYIEVIVAFLIYFL